MLGGSALQIESREHNKRGDRRRHAADGQETDQSPIDRPGGGMNEGPDRLGRRRVKQIGADGGRGMNAEQQDEERRHQRAAADSGHADQEADRKT